MFSFSLIVFREVIEVALVLTILLAGTRGVPRRGLWIAMGLALGAIGSVVVAFFAEHLTSAAEGMGQELFNATVLLTAAVLIGFTVLWMKRRGQFISAELKQLSGEVRSGKKPLSMLATIVGLSCLREGSEIVLLGHGIIAGGDSKMMLLTGGVLGLLLGCGFGVAPYLGLIKMATRRVFQISSVLLIVLSAGMVSQAVGFLAAGDFIPASNEALWTKPLWDSSAIVSEHGIAGQLLRALIGYTARPSTAQVAAFCLVLAFLFSALRFLERPKSSFRFGTAAVATALLLGVFIFVDRAFAIDKIYSPIIEPGEIEFETRGRYSWGFPEDIGEDYKQVFGIGYAPLDWWAIEAYGIIEDTPEESGRFEAVELENRFQLFDQGRYFIDVGLYAALEYVIDEDEVEGEAKILLEKQFGDFISTANLILEGIVTDGNHDTEAGAAINVRYRANELFEPGIEMQSEFGELESRGSWDDQEHVLGPVVYGKLFQALNYEVAFLFGISEESPDYTVRWTFEYGMY